MSGVIENPMLFWLCFYGFFFAATAWVGYMKDNTVAGVLLGYVLGPIGLVLLLLSHDRKHGKCPHCGTTVNRHAYLCPKCEGKCYKQLV